MRGALATLVAVLALLGTASGAGGSTSKHGSIAGIVPHVGNGAPAPFGLSKSIVHLSPSLTFDANYESLINRYFTDVAAASVAHSTTNVYSTDTQYFSQPGTVHIQYDSTFGGSFVSHDPLPANGCDDGVDAFCLTDSQLQAEIQNALTANGWHGSPTNMFFLMTPDGVGSCTDSSGNVCSSNFFCAYHSDFVDSSSEDVIYANEPYEGTIGGCANPFDQGFPNDIDADTTINTISHEHNEAITDPFGTAWLAADGNENGDLCAFGFGTQLGGTPGVDSWNQVINGHNYELQEEFSNADFTNPNTGCVLQLGGPSDPPIVGSNPPLVYGGGPVMHTNTTYAIYWLPTPGNSTQPAITGTAAVNHALTSSVGSWTASPTAFAFQWQRCSPAGTGCVNIPGATASTYALTSADGGNTVRSTVRGTNVNGASAFVASAPTAVVAPVPAATHVPVISGIAAVGRSFSTTNGTWNTSLTFSYQWLRCAANGSGCAAIPAATANTYPLVSADAKHVLKAVVSASNAAGTTSATSKATPVVVTAPHVRSAPKISGKAKVGKRLSGSRGSWSGPPTSYKYQWLRCSRSGAHCRSIKKATHATYRVTSHDAEHRLRLRVTAVNAAGAHAATSRPTAPVSH